MSKGVFLFDLDGTLTDPRTGILACTRHALKVLGRTSPSDDILASFIGPPLRSMFCTLLGNPEQELIEEAVRLYRERYTHTGIYETLVYDGVPAMLEQVRAAASAMFVVTSKPTLFAERIVEHFGIAAHFTGVYGAQLDGRFDNKAELIGHLLTTEGIGASDALVIGDRAVDVIAANAHRIPSIGVLWGYGSESELNQAGARTLCSTPSELRECLCRDHGSNA